LHILGVQVEAGPISVSTNLSLQDDITIADGGDVNNRSIQKAGTDFLFV